MGCIVSTSNPISQNTLNREKIVPTSVQSNSQLFPNHSNFSNIQIITPSLPQDAQTAQIIQKTQNLKDISLISEVLHSHFLFKDLDHEFLCSLIRKMKYFKLGPNEFIFYQKNPGRYLFIISKGEIEILVDHTKVRTLSAKSILGELALIHNSKRTASAVTLTKVELWGLDRESFKNGLKAVAQKRYEENKACIKKCELFMSLDDKAINKVLDMTIVQVFDRQSIIREGEPGCYLYLVLRGVVRLSLNGEVFKEICEGEYFGEQGFVNGYVRSCSAFAVGKVMALCFNPEELVKVIGEEYYGMVDKNYILISFKNDEFLKQLLKSQGVRVFENMGKRKYRKDEVLAKKGREMNKIIVPVRGTVSRDSQEIKRYSCIGSEILINQFACQFCYRARTDVEALEITKEKFEEILGGSLAILANENGILKCLYSSSLFLTTPEEELRLLAKQVCIQSYLDGQVIPSQNAESSDMYIIKSGKIKVTIENQFVRTLAAGCYFKGQSLFNNSEHPLTITAKGNTSLLLIKREVFQSFNSKILPEIEQRIYLQDYSIELKDLSLLKFLNKGTLGYVFLAIHRENLTPYSLKTILKSKIDRLKISKNLESAEKALLKIDSPFILKLVKPIKDQERVYFLIEFVFGINFYQYIKQYKPIAESYVKFYIANIVLILQHLNERKIAHRDLKTENIIIDTEGYLKLVEFDTITKIKERSYTLVGTPHYMAPEMIKGCGYDLAVDYWSLGVILYEVVYESLPFADFTEDPIEIYRNILEGKVEYKSKNKNYNGVIKKLIETNPGIRADFTDLMKDDFFCGIKWEDVLLRKVDPPFKPRKEKIDIPESLPGFSEQLIVEEETKRHKKTRVS